MVTTINAQNEYLESSLASHHRYHAPDNGTDSLIHGLRFDTTEYDCRKEAFKQVELHVYVTKDKRLLASLTGILKAPGIDAKVTTTRPDDREDIMVHFQNEYQVEYSNPDTLIEKLKELPTGTNLKTALDLFTQ